MLITYDLRIDNASIRIDCAEYTIDQSAVFLSAGAGHGGGRGRAAQAAYDWLRRERKRRAEREARRIARHARRPPRIDPEPDLAERLLAFALASQARN
jgi:hypothetical protein